MKLCHSLFSSHDSHHLTESHRKRLRKVLFIFEFAGEERKRAAGAIYAPYLLVHKIDIKLQCDVNKLLKYQQE